MSKRQEYSSGRKPCPHCGGMVLGIGFGHNPATDTDECSVKCQMCGSRGPFCTNEDDAWEGWNSRFSSSPGKMKKHIKLCKRNLKSDRVKCCATCPFEDMIISEDKFLSKEENMEQLFKNKRSMIEFKDGEKSE